MAGETGLNREKLRDAARAIYPNMVKCNAVVDSDLIQKFKDDVRLMVLVGWN
jgi:hypothetical protein